MADQRIHYNEQLVGAGHPTKTDTINRLALIEHNNDGTHNKLTQVKDPYTDLRAYLPAGYVTDGSVNYASCIQAAITDMPDGGTLLFPKGSWMVDNTTIYLTSANNNATYILKGQGKGTILKPTNFASGYVFKLNEDSGGNKIISFPTHPRLIVEDMVVDATGSTGVSLLWFNQASFHFRRLKLLGLLYGATGTNYTDIVSMEDIVWSSPVSGGWLYKQAFLGDCFYGRHLFSTGNDMVYLYRCLGAVLETCIGGHYRFQECAGVVFNGAHCEFNTVNHTIEINNSTIAIGPSFFRNDDSTKYPIYLNDDPAVTQPTRLTLCGNTFGKNLNDPTPGYHELRVNAINSDSRITLRDNRVSQMLLDATDMNPWESYPLGIIVSSAVGALNNVLALNRPLHSSEVEILYSEGTWRTYSPGGNTTPLKALTNPTISSVTEATNPTGSLATSTTYYYKVTLFDQQYRSTAASAESSVAIAGATSSAKIIINGTPHTWVRVYRGTSTGIYDRYCDIPVVGNTITLFDKGSLIGQQVWTTGGGPYTPPSANVTYSGTLKWDGTKVVYGTAAPTGGAWVVGDRLYNSTPTVGQPKSWVCTAAGSPGTWTSEGNL